MATATSTDLCHTEESGDTMTINKLPDNVLIEIFDLCRKDHKFHRFIHIPRLKDIYNPDSESSLPVWRWHGLVQVCQRWRQIIFGSPRRLDLQILCSRQIPVRENLDSLPPFPIAIQYLTFETLTPDEEKGLSAAFEHPGRIRQVDLCLRGPQLGKVATAMQQPFPALTHLTLGWHRIRPVLPSGFLGGSAPCLKYMHLERVLFPELPMFLSSTSDLVNLYLNNIPRDGYISPEAMTACLVALPRLRSFFFGSLDTSHADHIHPPPVTRTLLPALTSFGYRGHHEYLEDLVARIDSPRLSQIYIEYGDERHRGFDFQAEQLVKFINCSEDPEMSVMRHADINFSLCLVTFEMYPSPENRDWGRVTVLISCEGFQTQVSRMSQVFGQPSAILSHVVHLKLSQNEDYIDAYGNAWLVLLRQFLALRALHVSRRLAPCLVHALKRLPVEMVAEVVPVLDLLYLEDEPASPSRIEEFLTACRLSGHPITIFEREAEFNERFEVLRHQIR